jgi:hypothetical protein
MACVRFLFKGDWKQCSNYSPNISIEQETVHRDGACSREAAENLRNRANGHKFKRAFFTDLKRGVTLHQFSAFSGSALPAGSGRVGDRFPIEMSTFRIYQYKSRTIIVNYPATFHKKCARLGAGAADAV